MSPQLLFDAMSLMIHHNVDAALRHVGGKHSLAERRDVAVVCCIDRLRKVLAEEKAMPEMFQSLQHGYVEAAWLQRLWPPESPDSRDGALHLLRMLAQAQLCFALDDTMERFQFPSLLPANNKVASAKLITLSPSLRGGTGGAAGFCLQRTDSSPGTFDAVQGCARVLEQELAKVAADDAAATTKAINAVVEHLDSVEQFLVLAVRDHEVRRRLRAAQVAADLEELVCGVVDRVRDQVLHHKRQQGRVASMFPPDFVHHLQMHVVSQATAKARLQDVALWRDGILFPMNLVSRLPWSPEVLVQLQVHEGSLLVLALLDRDQQPADALSFEQALPVVLEEVVQVVRDSGNFVGLEWRAQMLDAVQLTAAVRRTYVANAQDERTSVNLDSRLVFAAPDMPLPPKPQGPTRASLPVTVQLLLQRCGLSALVAELQPQITVERFMQAWKIAIDTDDAFSFFMNCLQDFDAVDVHVEHFMGAPLALEFADGMLHLCAEHPANSSGQCRQDLQAALAQCDVDSLFRVFVDVLAWDTLDMCQTALNLLRHAGRLARGAAGTQGSTDMSFLQSFLDLLGLDETERTLMLKLVRPDTTVALLTNTVAHEPDVGERVQKDADELRCAIDERTGVFPAASTHCLQVLQAVRSADVAAQCVALGYFFKPKLAVVWFGGHGDQAAAADASGPALCFQHDHMTGQELRQHLRALRATTTLLFLETCFSQDITHDSLVFEGLLAYAFAARGQLITPGAAKEVLVNALRAGHSCGVPNCNGCTALRTAAATHGGWITAASLVAHLQFHRSQVLRTQGTDNRPTNVVASLEQFLIPVLPYVSASQ